MNRQTRWVAWICMVSGACGAKTASVPNDISANSAPPAATRMNVSPVAGAPASNAAGTSAPSSSAAQPQAAASPAPEVAGKAAVPSDSGAQPVDADAEYLGLAQPARGFRMVTRGRTIEPQSDVEYCEVGEIPGSPETRYVVGGTEVANAAGSHHLIVTIAAPGSFADRQLRTYALGEQVPCIGAGAEFGQEGMSSLAGSQTRYVKADLPKGVGLRVYGGQRVVFDYHYFNFSDAPLTAKSAIAVHELGPDEPVTFSTTLAFTNMTIDTPPQSEKTFTAVCHVKHAVMLGGVARHTHANGTNFDVLFEGGARHGEKLWTSTDWEHDIALTLREPIRLEAGEGFKFSCSFRNQTTKPLRFGIGSRDEMCILAAAIWSPTPQAELEPESCVVTWTDSQGIGHDAEDAGGFPKSDFEDALSCHAGTLGLSLFEGCLGCICDSCATIMARCNADADCKALLDCNGSCTQIGTSECSQRCEPVMFEHSSGVGLITQVGLCLQSSCGSPCALPAM